MISDRAPEAAERANAILDQFLDGALSEWSAKNKLRKVIRVLPPKWCGCHFCTVSQKNTNEINESEEDDGA